MNKSGFLLAEETLKIVLAVIAIAFLVYFLYALYFSNIQAEKLKQAEAVLIGSDESIEVVINRVRSSQVLEVKNVYNPTGWWVFGFVSDPKPDSCAGQNCLCICDKVSEISFYSFTQEDQERQANKCTEKGVCLVVEDLKNSLEKEIKKHTIDITLSYSGGIEIR